MAGEAQLVILDVKGRIKNRREIIPQDAKIVRAVGVVTGGTVPFANRAMLQLAGIHDLLNVGHGCFTGPVGLVVAAETFVHGLVAQQAGEVGGMGIVTFDATLGHIEGFVRDLGLGNRRLQVLVAVITKRSIAIVFQLLAVI
jgi:hypothetical protein